MKSQKSKIFDGVRKNRKSFLRKGQGLSLNTIIVAAIVLIVLVVLWAIFTGRMGVFTKGVKDVGNCAETCKAAGEEESTGANDTGRHSLGQVGGKECFCKPAAT